MASIALRLLLALCIAVAFRWAYDVAGGSSDGFPWLIAFMGGAVTHGVLRHMRETA